MSYMNHFAYYTYSEYSPPLQSASRGVCLNLLMSAVGAMQKIRENPPLSAEQGNNTTCYADPR